MTDVIKTEDRNGIRLIIVDNPPVNALSVAVCTGIKEAVDAAVADDSVKAIVLTGEGRAFIAGADIREFGKPRPKDAPTLRDDIVAVEMSPKTTVAAINGAAAGGGLELALGCHYRVATEKAMIGLPEVNLGTIPGATGTQRLPRIVGLEKALDLIIGAKLIPGKQAHALGIVDELADDVVARAIELAESKEPRRLRDIRGKLDEEDDPKRKIEEFKKSIARKYRGFEAPFVAADAVGLAWEYDYDTASQKEREMFVACQGTEQALGMRHAFFADREVTRVPDVPKDTPTQKIEKAGIVGFGTMGGGIAMNFANAGIPVTVVEIDREALDKGFETVKGNYQRSVKSGRFTQEQVDERLGRITPTTDMKALADADIVIEAVVEKMDVKKDIFEKLDEICKDEAILATNTSTLDVDEIAAATDRPEKVMGTHFFSPANVMRLMENVRGEKTSKETIATVQQLSKKIGKVGVVVGVCDGFVGNRMLYAYTRQAGFLLEEGALPQQVDKVIYDFGLPMGPFQMGDLAGLDVGYYVRQERFKKHGKPTKRYSPIGDRVFEAGRMGQKNGKGWYRYEEGKREPIPDPEVHEIIEAVSEEKGIERRAISDEEILERCMYALVNEGAKILEEGVAQRPIDIDMIWIYGYGFPRYRGGPMFWADRVGLDKILERLQFYRDNYDPDWLEPAPLLQKLAKEEKGFGDWSKER